MAINPTGAAAVPLTVWGSWCTEVAPESVPQNISPDCGDVAFAPGQVGSRPALQRVFSTPFPAGGPNNLVPSITYAKSFKTPTGDIKNLYLDSNGILWVEDLSNSPGFYSELLASTPGSYARSVTAFGKEFIAISDGLHGTEVPLQFDGTNLDRVTQDGPGAPPSIANLNLGSAQMSASPNTLTRNGNTVTCNTATPHNLKVGYQAQISGVPDSNSTSVSQSNNAQTYVGGGDWQYVGTQFRTHYEPVTTALADLVFSNFGFTIPSAATILGVVVSAALVSQSSTASTLSQVALWYAGAQQGTAKSPATLFTTTVTQQSYGGSADQWGSTLTPAIVNDPSFGFAMAVNTDNVRVFIGQPFSMTVYYTLSGSGTVAFVQSIVIDNESNPGLALVTTTAAHGLSPGVEVSIIGVQPGSVANLASAQWSAGTTTITTATSHGLIPGSIIQIASVTTSTSGTAFSFNGTFTVQTVPSPTQLTYGQTPITSNDPDVINATANTGNIVISWPIPDNTPTPTYFEVMSAPSATTFMVQVSYSDGTWTTGTVGFAWEGTFYVTGVASATQFSYQQYGPNGATSAVGTATPFGQAAPGLHLMQVLFLDRQGGITAPSPPVTFIANGGQYLSVTNIPIGGTNIVARILAFTGAQPNVPGTLPPFFYIPVTPQTEGQIVGTSTQINDNTTTAVVLDFSDNSLFAALGISTPGNTLANQIVLDGALAFGSYQSRLLTWGQRNRINNLLNMGFDGGYLPTAPTLPTGWSYPGIYGSGALSATAIAGFAWSMTGNGTSNPCAMLTQSAYEDAYGTPILTGNTLYSFRAKFTWANGVTNGTFVAELYSPTAGSLATASISIPNTGLGYGFLNATFSASTPLAIPTDTLLRISLQGAGNGITVTVDEQSLIFAQNPYTDSIAYGSYVNNPSGMDGVSGQYGPADDSSKLMDQAILRDTLYLLTQAPSGRLHETTGSGTSEPVGWQVNEVAANCGTLSAFGLTHSQADDTAASGGDDWMAWPSEGGALIFGGGIPEKITQEIQPNWYDPSKTNTAIQINMAAATTAWAVNDPVQRLLMFGLPIGSATAPNKVYVLNYDNLNSASAIVSSPPFHPSFAGKLIATDNSRKWAPWTMSMNGAARMYRSAGVLSLVLFGGNGQTPGAAASYGNVYTLNPALLTDQDYGQIYPYYTTYFFLDPEQAQGLQLKGGRIMLAYLRAYIQGTGNITASYLCDKLTNVWPLSTTRALTQVNFDREFGGGYAQGDRIAVRIASSPASGTDNGFVISRMTAFFKDAKMAIRGAAQ